MKKIIYLLSLSLLIGSATQSCEMTSKEDKAKEATAKAEAKVQEANVAAEEAAKEQEWVVFKSEAERKIQENEKRINDLRAKLTKPGKMLDGIYKQRIEAIELKNAELRAKISSYESTQSDWENFKADFNRELDAVGKSISDFATK
jgi:chromosome segregation ATPase